MSATTFYVLITILIVILAVLVFLFFKFQKKKNVDFFETPQPKKEFKQKDIKVGVIDIFELLKLQSEILFEECARFDNTIFINYPKELPRIYDNSAVSSLQILNLICKFFAFEFQKTTIKVDFSSLRVTDNKILLSISIKSDKFLSQNRILAIKNFFDGKQDFDNANLIKAKKIADKSGNFLHFDTADDKITINFNSNLVFYRSSRFSFLKNKYHYNVLICENNEAIFNDLSLFFAQINCSVGPNSSWLNIKKHLDDFIYKPDIVLIEAEILKNQNELEYLNSIQKNKNAYFAFILRNSNDLKLMKKLNFNAFKIKMPYLYDDLYALCEVVTKAKQTGFLSSFE